MTSPVATDPANGHAAKVGPVIPSLATNKPVARMIAFGVVVSQRHFQGCICAFGPGTSKEDTVETGRHQLGQFLGEAKSERVTKLKCRPVIENPRLIADRLRYFLAAVSSVHAP